MDSLTQSPYASSLGVIVEADEDGARCRMRYSDILAGFGALHGGALGALLELSSNVELCRRCDGPSTFRLVSMTTEFLRAGQLEDTFARAYIVRQGRRVANVRAEAWQGERNRLIAVAHSLFLFT